MDRIIRNMCSNANYSGGTATIEEVDTFLASQSGILFCHGRMFRVVFEKITDKTFSIKREWL
jgi:hypothetical protein